MLSQHLQKIWDNAGPTEKANAEAIARHTLGNLVHYSNSARRAHYDDDVRMMAATLLSFRQHRGT